MRSPGNRYTKLEAHRGKNDNFKGGRDSLARFWWFFEKTMVFSLRPNLSSNLHSPKLSRKKIRTPHTRGFAGPIAARREARHRFLWHQGIPNGRRAATDKLENRFRYDQGMFYNVYEQKNVRGRCRHRIGCRLTKHGKR